MAEIYDYIPEAQGEEALYLDKLLSTLEEEDKNRFANIYRSRRKDPQTIMLLTLLGFLGIAGIQRFILNQIGMGILYILTGGLCLIGVIVDLVNHKDLALQYNRQVAQEVKSLL